MSILKYLESSAERFPDKTAIADREHGYTFNELQQASYALAAVSPLCDVKGKGIGVFVERNADMIVCFLAIAASGNYYIPLDIDMPASKLNIIINNSGIELIIGSEECAKLLDGVEAEVDYISTDMIAGMLSDTDMLQNTSEIADTADDEPLFMIYTSGSTGVPKGVLKSHRAMMSFIEAYVERFGFDESETIGNQTPFFFDAAAKDIYLMLKTGATMEILPTEFFAMPPSLIRYMNERKVSMISWVPSALSVVVQLNTFSAVLPETLKRVLFVGEVMPMKHLNKWIDALPDLQYVNLYGSTEVAGVSCCYEVDRRFENDENLPMGKPLTNCKVYLMDNGRPVDEPGHIGEMYVVSDALAMCYYGDPEKTEKTFVMMDFEGDGHLQRAYKSGDLAQYDEDGNLIFASRSDFQIKHMGHRIELGEIETAAGALEGIQRCACLYNDKKSRMVLFCTIDPACTKTGNDIKAELASKLSSYMVPNRVNILDEMPYNANNKIDRQKLKEML